MTIVCVHSSNTISTFYTEKKRRPFHQLSVCFPLRWTPKRFFCCSGRWFCCWRTSPMAVKQRDGRGTNVPNGSDTLSSGMLSLRRRSAAGYHRERQGLSEIITTVVGFFLKIFKGSFLFKYFEPLFSKLLVCSWISDKTVFWQFFKSFKFPMIT